MTWMAVHPERNCKPPLMASEAWDRRPTNPRGSIPNWSNDEFAAFVHRLGAIIDRGVLELIAEDATMTESRVVKRVQETWNMLLEAEAAFWPSVG